MIDSQLLKSWSLFRVRKKHFKQYLREAELPKPSEDLVDEGMPEETEGDDTIVESPSFEKVQESLKKLQSDMINLRELPLDQEGKIMSEFDNLQELMETIRSGLESKFFKLRKLNDTKKRLAK